MLNVYMNTHILHLRSIDGIVSNNTYKFIVPSITKKLENKFKISLVSFSLPYSWGNINSRNNKIDYTESDLTGTITNTLSITLDNGSYDIENLADTIKYKLNSNTQQGIVYDITYDEIKNKITISINNSDTKVIFLFSSDSICYLLGFDYTSYELTKATPLTSPNIVNTYPDECIYFRTNITALNSFDSYVNDKTDILQKINITCARNEFIYLSDIITPIFSDSNNINQIDIMLTDENNNYIDIENNNFTCSLLVEEITDEIPQIQKELGDIKTLLLELLKLQLSKLKSKVNI